MSVSVRNSSVARTERSHSATSVSWLGGTRAADLPGRRSSIPRPRRRQARRRLQGASARRPTRSRLGVPPKRMMLGSPDADVFCEALLLVVVHLDELEVAFRGDVLEHGCDRVQGVHHSAQKSTSTGLSAWMTSCSNVVSVT